MLLAHPIGITVASFDIGLLAALSALCATASRCLNVYCQSVLTSYWHRRGRCLSFYTPGGPYRAHGEDEGNGQGGPHNLGVRAWLGQRYALCASILFPVWYVVQIHSFPSSAEFFLEIATLIEGPTDAHIIQDIPGVTGGVAHDDCAISGETAICTLVLSAQGTATTMGIQTEAVSALAIQVATAPSSPTSSGDNTAATRKPY